MDSFDNIVSVLPSEPDDRDYNIAQFIPGQDTIPDEEFCLKLPQLDIIIDQLNVGACHDGETQVLTRLGWKYFKDINKNDLLASVNPIDGNLIFEKPTNLIKYKYHGDMVVGKHQSLDFMVTPNHKMVVKKWNQSERRLDENYTFVDAGSLGWYSALRTNFYQKQSKPKPIILEEEVIANGNLLPRIEISMEDWVQFLGIYLSDGTMYQDGQKFHFRIQLAATRERKKIYFKKILTKLGINGINEQVDRFQFHSKRVWKLLESYGLLGKKAVDKFIPDFIFDLDHSIISKFLYGYAMGDGHLIGDEIAQYYTTSKKLADQLQMLSLMRGRHNKIISRPPRTTIIEGREVTGKYDELTVCEWRSESLSIDRKKNISLIPYDDYVYCAEVPTYHTLITKRNECVLLSGNCVAHSLTTCKSIVEYNITNKWIDFSPFMLYGDRKDRDHQGPGMRPAEALYNLRKLGMWLRRDFNIRKEVPALYEDIRAAKLHHPELIESALDYAICGYARITTDDAVKKALKNNMPVTASWRLYPTFVKTGADGKVPQPAPDEDPLGAHQMTIIGWTKTAWIVVNSWGNRQAHNGMYYIPFTYKPYEMWSVSDTIFPARKKAANITLTIDDNNIDIDGEVRPLDVAPMIMGERTYLPVRVISEALGASVEWEEGEKEITIRSEEALISMWIGKTIINVNGNDIPIDVAPIIVNDRTFIPIRFISEHLNCTVDWLNDTRQVVIKTK